MSVIVCDTNVTGHGMSCQADPVCVNITVCDSVTGHGMSCQADPVCVNITVCDSVTGHGMSPSS